MTFSILGYCGRTGKAGFCQATSTPAVGWRITDVVVNRGIVTVQSHGDFRRLQLAKRLMELGLSPAKVLKDLQEGDKFGAYRQIAILDFYDNSAVFTGGKTHPWSGEIVGTNHIATGNGLVSEQVVQSMSDAFIATENEELEERLLRALEAGRDAGGQPIGQRSSALVVYEREAFPIVNLRIDLSAEPVNELRKVFDWFKHVIPHYVARTNDPSSVSSLEETLKKLKLPQNPYCE